MHYQACFSVVLWLSLCSLVAGNASSQKTTFQTKPVCPNNNSLSQLNTIEGALDARTCTVACAANSNCSVSHHRNGIGYFANSTQLIELFNQSGSQGSGTCESHVKDYMGSVKSKLVVFFDFRQGFSNLISPGTFNAAPQGSITRDSQGAHFPGGSSDFIEVDTQSGSLISNYLDHSHNFSFFAKVVRQDYYEQNYHYFYDCSSTTSAGVFGDRDRRAWVQHKSVSFSSKQTRQSVSSPFLLDNIPQAASLGAAFYNMELSNFYLNGTSIPAESDMGWSINGSPVCLRLGYHTDGAKVLEGRMICYAIAKAALSTEEFQQMDNMCQ